MRNSFLLLSLLFVCSCQPKWVESDLFGKWNTVSWTIEDTGKSIDQRMDFTFNDDKTYFVDYGSEKENGKFWLETDYLVTVEEGKYEKKVKIIRLTQDSFAFRMNRAGRYENVLLVK